MNPLVVTRIASLALAAAACGAGFYFGRSVPFADQWPVYDGLRQTASIVFGITGAWAAIAYPAAMTSLLRRGGDDLSFKEQGDVRKLLRPMYISAAVLAALLMIAIAIPIARRSGWVLAHRDALRGISFAFVSLLTFAEMWAVIFLLVPLDNAKSDIDLVAAKRRVVHGLRPVLRGEDRDDD